MKKKNSTVLGAVFLAVLLVGTTTGIMPATAADTLEPSDFNQKSWSKTIDFFDYVRAYASAHGKTPPPANWHAYLYLTYINTGGLQVLYGGLANITTGPFALTIPIQTFMEHYKTKENKTDVIMASSFLMLLAYNESADSIHSGSPDKNDTLYASFSLGRDLSEYFGDSTPPRLNSETTIIPLTSSPDGLQWHWGMRYTNLTAIWWRIYIDPLNPRHDLLPIAVTVYDELTFTYNLTINPSSGNATLTANYIIGKMKNLWLLNWFFLGFTLHYNSTGCYLLNGVKYSNETIYQFLHRHGIRMSIVLFQSSVLLDRTTYSNSNGQNVTDEDVFVSDASISTYSDDNEKIFETSFGSKETYNLYNYTEDPTETSYDTYNALTRTCRRVGFARNPIFDVHTSLMRFIPLVVAHMDPPLYEEAKDHLLNMTYSDYFYIVSYPTYDGYRVEHDPTFTAYYSPTTTGLSVLRFLIVGSIAAIAIVAIVAVVLTRRKSQALEATQQPF